MRHVFRLLILVMLVSLQGCGYNLLQSGDEQIKAAWSEVINQYQRRADLVPNLVKTVQAYATHEQQVLAQVADARSRVGSMQVPKDVLNDPTAFARFQAAQGQLSSALSRLLAVSENYPQLKADTGFRDLQAQLEGTENRIAVARQRYIRSVQDYNVVVRSFPSNLTAMILGMQVKPNFTVGDEKTIARPPSVEFGNEPAR